MAHTGLIAEGVAVRAGGVTDAQTINRPKRLRASAGYACAEETAQYRAKQNRQKVGKEKIMWAPQDILAEVEGSVYVAGDGDIKIFSIVGESGNRTLFLQRQGEFDMSADVFGATAVLCVLTEENSPLIPTVEEFLKANLGECRFGLLLEDVKATLSPYLAEKIFSCGCREYYDEKGYTSSSDCVHHISHRFRAH